LTLILSYSRYLILSINWFRYGNNEFFCHLPLPISNLQIQIKYGGSLVDSFDIIYRSLVVIKRLISTANDYPTIRKILRHSCKLLKSLIVVRIILISLFTIFWAVIRFRFWFWYVNWLHNMKIHNHKYCSLSIDKFMKWIILVWSFAMAFCRSGCRGASWGCWWWGNFKN